MFLYCFSFGLISTCFRDIIHINNRTIVTEKRMLGFIKTTACLYTSQIVLFATPMRTVRECLTWPLHQADHLTLIIMPLHQADHLTLIIMPLHQADHLTLTVMPREV